MVKLILAIAGGVVLGGIVLALLAHWAEEREYWASYRRAMAALDRDRKRSDEQVKGANKGDTIKPE